MAKGWIKDERELLQNPAAHTQPLPAYFGLSMMTERLVPIVDRGIRSRLLKKGEIMISMDGNGIYGGIPEGFS
jgi:hypothetical protein